MAKLDSRLKRRIDVDEKVSTTPDNKALFEQLRRVGVKVVTIPETERVKRIMEPLSPEVISIMEIVMIHAKTLGVSADDCLVGELPSGVTIEIPRIQRRLLIRENIIAIATPTNAISMCVDDEGEWKEYLKEAMVFDKTEGAEGSVVSKKRTLVGEKSDMEAYLRSENHHKWYGMYRDMQTEKEEMRYIAMREQEFEQLIAEVRKRFPPRTLFGIDEDCFSRTRVGRTTFGDMMERFRILETARGKAKIVMFAAKVHGSNHPEVHKALQVLRMMT